MELDQAIPEVIQEVHLQAVVAVVEVQDIVVPDQAIPEVPAVPEFLVQQLKVMHGIILEKKVLIQVLLTILTHIGMLQFMTAMALP